MYSNPIYMPTAYSFPIWISEIRTQQATKKESEEDSKEQASHIYFRDFQTAKDSVVMKHRFGNQILVPQDFNAFYPLCFSHLPPNTATLSRFFQCRKEEMILRATNRWKGNSKREELLWGVRWGEW